jgi:uncharacterized protein
MIVDAHVHLGQVTSFYVPDAGLDALLALMDTLGIDKAISMHTAGIMECFEEAYAASERDFVRSQGRVPYCLTYHPLYPADSLACIRQALAIGGSPRPGCVGIKIHPGQHQVFPEDPRYEAIWKLADEHGLPMITHSWALSDYNPTQRFATPEHFEHYVARFPQVKLILGHAGGRYEGHVAAAQLARRYPNVYLDLSGDVYSFGFVEWLVAQVGAERILFGTDVDWIDPRTHLARVLDADITLAQKAAILGANACRLFKLTDKEV